MEFRLSKFAQVTGQIAPSPRRPFFVPCQYSFATFQSVGMEKTAGPSTCSQRNHPHYTLRPPHTLPQRLICSALQPRLHDNLHSARHSSSRPRVVLPSPPHSPPQSPSIMQLKSAGQSSASLRNSFLNIEESDQDGTGNNGTSIIAVFLGGSDDNAAYDVHNHSSASVSHIPEEEDDRPPSPPPSHRLLYATPAFALTCAFVFALHPPFIAVVCSW